MKLKFISVSLLLLFITACTSSKKEIDSSDAIIKEFICLGTEPFWSLEISNKGIVFSEADSESEYCIEKFSMSEDDGSFIFSSDSKKDFTALITKEKCSDNMSEATYNYKSIININGKKLSGCARERTIKIPELPFSFEMRHVFSEPFTEDIFEISLKSTDILNGVVDFNVFTSDEKLIFSKEMDTKSFLSDMNCFKAEQFDKIDSINVILKNMALYLDKNRIIRSSDFLKKNNVKKQLQTKLKESDWIFKLNEEDGLFHSKSKKAIIEF